MKGSRQRTSPTKRARSTTKRVNTSSAYSTTSMSSLSMALPSGSPSRFASTSSSVSHTQSRKNRASSTKQNAAVSSRRTISTSLSSNTLSDFSMATSRPAAPQAYMPSSVASPAPTFRRAMSTKVKAINCEDAPAAVGPYSHANVIGDMVFVSGQLPLDPKTMKFNSDTDVSLQTHQCLKNLQTILHKANSDLKHVAKTTILLNDIADFPKVNKVYAEYFTDHLPARICYAVESLPLGALVEIDAVAAVRDDKSDV